MTGTLLPPPSVFGLPDRYSTWRPHQEEAVERAVSNERRWTVFNAPTGFGKTVTSEVICAIHGGRSVYHVVSKALQGQILGDFTHRYDIRGKGNYDCLELIENGAFGQRARCDAAEHLCDGCGRKERGCLYFDAYRAACKAPSVIDNYAYWLAINRHGEGLGEFNAMIADEAHMASDQLSSALRITLSPAHVERFIRQPMPSAQSNAEWRAWAGKYVGALRTRLDALKLAGQKDEEMAQLRALVGALSDLAGLSGTWIEDRSGHKGDALFEPVWPGKYSQLLWQRTPHIVLMSATIVPKTMELLGVEPDQYELLQFPSSFPLERRPVIHVKTVQQKSTMSDAARSQVAARIDQIIDRRMDRKGIIHTVSYSRAREIYGRSRFSDYMILIEPGKVQRAVERFKESAAPRVLIGPSVDTGYDFPGEDAEYQIIAKVPFMDSRSPLTAARMAQDKDWGLYVAMQTIVQMAGRGMRSADDRCEVLIVDDMFVWFYAECVRKGFVPEWFRPAVRLNAVIPPPPEKLEEGKVNG